MPLRSKNSPPSGRLTLRIRSDLDAISLTSASAASSTASGVAASMTAMSWSIRCGNWAFSIASCWRQGSELDSSCLLSVLMAKWRVK